MTFISYAQNCEDVLLWRALGHVRDGFYIDVGANDPVEHSVTKAFYDAGWSGISIEPLPTYRAAFLGQRARDINLAVAAGAVDGELTLYDVPAVRGWASPSAEVAESHRAEGYRITELKVPVRTLATICAEHVKGEIHFLKIDVEGFEGEVLRGMDFARWRPWVLVIEATLPNSRVTNHQAWEHMVTAQRYRFAWFDGLNRYYVAEEHPELLAALEIQPNVFDDFISHHLDKAWAANKEVTRALRESEAHAVVAAIEAHDAHERANAAEQEQREALAEFAELRVALAVARSDGHKVSEWARELEARLVATHASTSWKVTRPLRSAGALLRALRNPGLARRVLGRISANQRLRRLVIPLLLRYPALGQRVAASLAAIRHAAPAPNAGGAAVPEELRPLPASVRAVLADLQRARANHTSTP
jgi:FkbM family methyltransferase